MPSDPAHFPPLTHVAYHVLLSLARSPSHGYGIIKDVEEHTEGRVVLEAGTLYAAIKRFRDECLIVEVPTPAGTDARRRCYGLTAMGREVVRVESERLAELVALARTSRVLPGGERDRAEGRA
jgi:DNA-binding PadR family transcriptional regulator